MKIERLEKLVSNLHYKTEYVIHIGNLNHALNHGLSLKELLRVIKFNRKAWHTMLRQKTKNNFEKDSI